jgi:hypothetical protein
MNFVAERPLYARFASFYDVLFPRFDPGIILEGSGQRDGCLWQMRTFTPAEVRAVLVASGFTVCAMLGWYDFGKELGSTDRITVVAQRWTSR